MSVSDDATTPQKSKIPLVQEGLSGASSSVSLDGKLASEGTPAEALEVAAAFDYGFADWNQCLGRVTLGASANGLMPKCG